VSNANSPAVPLHAPINWTRFILANVPYVVLYAVAIWLVAVTNSNPAQASIYWKLFIPVVGLVATIDGWKYAGPTSRDKTAFVVKQVLHWGVLLIVVNLLFLQSMLQFLNAENHGFVIIYLLGLAASLSGIHLDWKMAIFGAFLIMSGIGIGYIEDNLLVMLTATGVALAAIVVTLVIRLKMHGQGKTG